MLMALLVLSFTFGVVCFLEYSTNLDSIYSQLNNVLARVVSSQVPQIEGVQPIKENDSVSEALETSNTFYNTERNVNSFSNSSTDSLTSSSSSSDSSSTSDASSSSVSSGTVGGSTSVNAYVYDSGTLQSESESNDIVTPPNIGDTLVESGPVILTAVYRVNVMGFYTTMPDYSEASIAESILIRANDAVLDSTSDKGFLSEFDLCYDRAKTSDGYIVAYGDARSLHSWEDLASMLTGVGLIALFVFFLINLVFSKWALKPVELSIKQQQQFTADASHELKTPLTVILANMSILESQPDSTVSEQMQWVESTQTEAERMQLLVNDMLDLARPQTEEKIEKTPEKQDVDVSDLVEGEVLQFESVAFERGIELVSHIKPDLHVQGDKESLGRMVATLIDNACKYSEKDGKVEIRLFSRPGSGMKSPYVKLTVHNDETISEEDLPHLFDRFYRADKARTSGKGGYGLGLAIGREIARQHKGDITVSSSKEKGTTFSVTLPLDPRI